MDAGLKSALLQVAIQKIAKYFCSSYMGQDSTEWFEELVATKRLLRSMPEDEVLEMADAL